MKGRVCSIKMQKSKYIVSDLVMTAVAFFIFNICRYSILARLRSNYEDLWQYVLSDKLIFEDILIPFVMLGIYALSGFYNHPFQKSRLSVIANTLCTSFIGAVCIYMVVLLNDIGMRRMDYLMILILMALIFIFVYTGRYLITRRFMDKLQNREVVSSTLIIGNSDESRRMARRIMSDRTQLSRDIIGFIRLPDEEGENDVDDDARVWDLDQIADICAVEKPDQLVIATMHRSDRRVMEIVDSLLFLDIPIKIAPDTLSYVTSNIRLGDIMGTPFVDLTSPRLSDFQTNLKRLLDVVVSALMLIMLSPLLLCVAIMVKRSSKGPAIYSQQRLGRRQKPFTIYKFRTMILDSEPCGPRLTDDDDPRITSIGRFLRKYRIDELPQLWNVLRGDMSLVGPRPEREFFVKQILEEAPYFSLVYQIRPGITSWGMVKYGYASNVRQMVERSRYELVYLNNMSIATDIKILAYTIRTVLSGQGK